MCLVVFVVVTDGAAAFWRAGQSVGHLPESLYATFPEAINALLVARAQPGESLFSILVSGRSALMLSHLFNHGGLPDPSVAFQLHRRLSRMYPLPSSEVRTTLDALKERWRSQHWPLIHSCLCDDVGIPAVLTDLVRRYLDGEDAGRKMADPTYPSAFTFTSTSTPTSNSDAPPTATKRGAETQELTPRKGRGLRLRIA